MTLSYDPAVALNASGALATPEANFLKQETLKRSPISLPGTDCQIKYGVPLATLTSYRVGGPAEWYLAPRRLEDLQAGFYWGLSEGLPVTVLGAGSNLLVSDRGLPGLTICTRYLRHTHFDAETGTVTVAAGEPLVRLAWQAAERGWQGLEWAVGIPGTVGGAVVMNAGAHHSCAADILVNTHVLNPDGRVEILTPPDLGYRYRTSVLQGGNRLVTQATFQLRPGADPAKVMAETEHHLKQRQNSQPYHLPSCGSVFRNPTPHKAGWLIEHTGLKGYQIGGAQVAQRHANFIVNCGGAKASDIFQLIRYVQEQVEKQWSLLLEPEVKIIGEFQPI
ncbi:UDP-N-acetylmuramate dehydrogenase [Kamptonema formosum]|uniref:UDP-N-acetylmuramate dehydrogenase n=1 Tax=Kamptonema formosum TaxID=331992 RepID=UPI00034CAF37|nr:UDP-N-acetylmuramate dehydrogenase [Oscillatoria sp. PCC 10802]